MSYRFADNLRVGSGQNCSSVLILLASCQHICHCRVCSENLLMMDRGNVRNMQIGSVLILLAELSTNLYEVYHCCVYSEKLLMMDRGTVRNM